VRIPLRGLLRQRRAVAQVAGEFNVMDNIKPDTVRGRLLIRLANIARQPRMLLHLRARAGANMNSEWSGRSCRGKEFISMGATYWRHSCNTRAS